MVPSGTVFLVNCDLLRHRLSSEQMLQASWESRDVETWGKEPYRWPAPQPP